MNCCRPLEVPVVAIISYYTYVCFFAFQDTSQFEIDCDWWLHVLQFCLSGKICKPFHKFKWIPLASIAIYDMILPLFVNLRWKESIELQCRPTYSVLGQVSLKYDMYLPPHHGPWWSTQSKEKTWYQNRAFDWWTRRTFAPWQWELPKLAYFHRHPKSVLPPKWTLLVTGSNFDSKSRLKHTLVEETKDSIKWDPSSRNLLASSWEHKT